MIDFLQHYSTKDNPDKNRSYRSLTATSKYRLQCYYILSALHNAEDNHAIVECQNGFEISLYPKSMFAKNGIRCPIFVPGVVFFLNAENFNVVNVCRCGHLAAQVLKFFYVT